MPLRPGQALPGTRTFWRTAGDSQTFMHFVHA